MVGNRRLLYIYIYISKPLNYFSKPLRLRDYCREAVVLCTICCLYVRCVVCFFFLSLLLFIVLIIIIDFSCICTFVCCM